jgi:hypothetical protein
VDLENVIHRHRDDLSKEDRHDPNFAGDFEL